MERMSSTCHTETCSSCLWKFIFSNQICAPPHCIRDNFLSSIRATEPNKQRAQMNSQLVLCRQRERLHERSWIHICMRSSAPLPVYIAVCACARTYVCAPRLPPLYLGRVSSSLGSIIRGKWNTFVSDCCMVRGGQINAFN